MRAALAFLVPFAILGCFAYSTWYVGGRLQSLFGLGLRWPVQVAVSAGVLCAVLAVGATAKSTSALVGALNVAGGYVVAFYLFLLVALLVLAGVQLKWNPSAGWSGAAVLMVAAAATAAGAWWADRFVVAETEIALSGLKRPLAVMQISDLHLGHHRGRAYLAEVVAETNRRRPDLVLITGDLVDAESALEPGVLDPLSELAAPAYFVGGNHEKYVGAERAFALIAAQGVRVLRNEVVESHGLQIVGLEYMNADHDTFDMHPSDNPHTIQSVLGSLHLKRELPAVMMHHSPAGARYAAEAGIGLMVAGHTHAGQLFPSTLFAALIFPVNQGLHEQGGTRVFVSQGAGTFLTRVRMGTSNEINLLHLVPGA